MTKPIVSVAALMLVEQGLLQLPDAVSQYLPMFARQQVAVVQDGKPLLVPVERKATVHGGAGWAAPRSSSTRPMTCSRCC